MEGLTPLHDRVMLRRIEAEEKTPGGIIIPIPQRKSRSKPRSWPLVQALGTRRASCLLDVAVGDRVLFGKWTGRMSSSTAKSG